MTVGSVDMSSILGLLALVLAVQFVLIAPAYALMRYAAAVDPRYERYSRWLRDIYLDDAEARQRNELTAAGGFGVLAVFAFFGGVYLLTAGGWPIAGVLVVAACIAAWCGEIFRDRYRSVVPTRAPPGEVALRCPNFAGVGLVKPDRVVQIRCGNCSTSFAADSSERALPSWLAAGALTALWIVMMRPWQGAFIPPERLLFTSMITAGLSWLWQFVTDLHRRERSARAIDFSVVRELRVVLLTIAASGFCLWCLNLYLANLVDPERRDVTVGWVQRSLLRTDGALALLDRFKIALWPSIAALIVGLILLRTDRLAFAKPVLSHRKDASRLLKRLSLVALTLSSFSLAGASTAGTLLTTAKFGLHSLNEKVDRDLTIAGAAFDRAVVTDSVVKALPREIEWPVDCRAKEDQPSCAARLLTAFDQEVERADALRQSWPEPTTVARAPVPSDPRAPAPGGVGVLRSGIEAAALRVEPVERATHINAQAFGSTTVGEIEAATAAINEVPSASQDGKSDQRKEIASLVVDLAFDLLRVDPTRFIKATYGDPAGKIAGAALGGAKKRYQEAVRDGLLKVVTVCSGGTAACQRAAAQATAKFHANSGSRPLVEALSSQAVAFAVSVEASLTGLRRRNEVSRAAMERLRAPVLATARIERWERLKREWTDINPAASSAWRAINILDRGWVQASSDVALATAASGRRDPQGGWDGAFLHFLRSHPAYARTVATMMLAVKQSPERSRQALADAYLSFVHDVDHTTHAATDAKDRTVITSPDFVSLAQVPGSQVSEYGTKGKDYPSSIGRKPPNPPRTPRILRSAR